MKLHPLGSSHHKSNAEPPVLLMPDSTLCHCAVLRWQRSWRRLCQRPWQRPCMCPADYLLTHADSVLSPSTKWPSCVLHTRSGARTCALAPCWRAASQAARPSASTSVRGFKALHRLGFDARVLVPHLPSQRLLRLVRHAWLRAAGLCFIGDLALGDSHITVAIL